MFDHKRGLGWLVAVVATPLICGGIMPAGDIGSGFQLVDEPTIIVGSAGGAPAVTTISDVAQTPDVISVSLDPIVVPEDYAVEDTRDSQVLSTEVAADDQERVDDGAEVATVAVTHSESEAGDDNVTTDTPQQQSLDQTAEADASQGDSEGEPSNGSDEAQPGAGEKLVSSVATELGADVAVVGVTWDPADRDTPVRVTYRTQENGQWGEWVAAMGDRRSFEPAESVESAQAEGTAVRETVPGTEPITVVGADWIEVAVETESAPVSGLALTVIRPSQERAEDGAASTGDAGQTGDTQPVSYRGVVDGGSVTQPDAVPAAMSTTIPGLTVHTRAEWGANERWMTWKPERSAIYGAVVHHTAGTNNYTQAQVPSLIAGIYYYHAVTLDWGDIGYNILIDKFGGAWQGRAGDLRTAVEGAHAYGANRTTFGVSVLGEYSRQAPSPAAIATLEKVLAWKLKLAGVPAEGTWHTTVAGTPKTVQRIDGHRSYNATACPGDAFFAKLPEVRRHVAELMQTATAAPAKPSPTPTPTTPSQPVARWSGPVQIGQGWGFGRVYSVGDFDGDGVVDDVIITNAGKLIFYSGSASGWPSRRGQIGQGWSGFDSLTGGIDWDGDGHFDIIARQTSTGDLRAYLGNGRGGFCSVVKIGQGWNGMSHITATTVGGRPAVYAISRSDGRLRVYPSTGTGRFLSPSIVGPGWGSTRYLIPVGDMDGDGTIELAAVNSAGRFMLYWATPQGTMRSAQQIGQGWASMLTVTVGGRHATAGIIDAVRPDGKLMRYTLSVDH